MPTITRLHTSPKAAKKPAAGQSAWAYLLLLPLVLFALSGFTFIPNKVQTPNQATATSLRLTLPMSALLTGYAADDSCSDVIIVEQLSLSGVKIYFNDCALEHLNAFLASANADASAGAAIIGLVTLLCEECAPIAPIITAVTAGLSAATGGLTATNDFLLYASKGCGGAFLDISWHGGMKFESACSTQDNGS